MWARRKGTLAADRECAVLSFPCPALPVIFVSPAIPVCENPATAVRPYHVSPSFLLINVVSITLYLDKVKD